MGQRRRGEFQSLAPLRYFQYRQFVSGAIDDIGKRGRGRPRTDATPVMVRLQPDQLAQLDDWIEHQGEPRPSRPEAIRLILADRLTPPSEDA